MAVIFLPTNPSDSMRQRLAFLLATLLCITAASSQTPKLSPPGSLPPSSVSKKTVLKKSQSGSRAGATKQVESGPCEVGILAGIGDQFTVKRVGLTIFGNEENKVPIESWNLNDLVFERVRATLASHVRVKRISVPKGTFAENAQAPGLAFRGQRTELNNIVERITSGANCQQYVLVASSWSKFSASRELVGGAGIVQVGSPPLHTKTFLYVITYIRVFDGQTFDVVRQDASSLKDETMLTRLLPMETVIGPNREMEEASFPASPPGAVDDPTLRDGARSLLKDSLDKTLPKLLGP